MSDALNTADTLLGATSPRLLPAPNAAIILDCSTPVFHINTSSVADPTSISFVARLIAIEGTVTFSSSGCTLSSISGNTCALLPANMTGATATVTASITYRGTAFSTTINLSKVVDGATGGTGSRGAGSWYASGTSWVDATADAATPGANITDDLVTITNGSTFAETRKWSGSAWVVLTAALNGNIIINGSLTDAQLTAIAAAKVTGTLTDSQLAAISAAKITGQITTTQITNNSITTGKIAANAVTASEIAADTITASQIAASAITSSELAAGAVIAGKITAGTIVAADIAASTITGAKIAANTITAGNITAGTITATEIAANTITTSRLLVQSPGSALNADPGFLDTSAWQTSACSITTISDGVSGNNVMRSNAGAQAEVDGVKVFPADLSKVYRIRCMARRSSTANGILYVGARLLDSSGTNITGPGGTYWYTSAGITIGTTFAEYSGLINVSGLAFTTACKSMAPIALLNVSASAGYMEIQDLRIEEVIPGTLIKDGAITTAKLVAGAVTANEIAANTITAAKIAAGTITATEIAASTITAGKMNVTDLSAITANLGSVDIATGGYVKSGQTAFNTGTGFWLGSVGGVPKFSIGSGSGNRMTWDGTTLNYEGTVVLPPFSVSLSGTLTTSRSNTTALVSLGTLSSSVTGGRGTLTYLWSVTALEPDPDRSVLCSFGSPSGTSSSVLAQVATDTRIIGTIVLTVTDADNRVATATSHLNCQFGTAR